MTRSGVETDLNTQGLMDQSQNLLEGKDLNGAATLALLQNTGSWHNKRNFNAAPIGIRSRAKKAHRNESGGLSQVIFLPPVLNNLPSVCEQFLSLEHPCPVAQKYR